MSNIVGVVDYGIAGNINSIYNAIKEAGGDAIIINSEEDFNKVDRIVMPGVGSFKDAMFELQSNNLVDKLKSFDGPILGICLGMQILSEVGFECGKTRGLGLIKAEVKPIDCDGILPNMGFNRIDIIRNSKLFNGIQDKEFYFMHSYEVVNFHDVTSTSVCQGHMFVSSIEKDNIFGVQFHPEKSRDNGIIIFKNFINL